MKAIQIKGKDQAEIIETPKPESKGERVIIKVKKCGICGSDIHMVKHGDENIGMRPGHEFSGVVVDPGPRDDLKIGDRVVSNFLNPCGQCEACKSGKISCCDQSGHGGGLGLSLMSPGGMAEYVACYPDYVYHIPEGIDFNLAAFTDPVAVALHAVLLGGVTVGDKVLITGGSSIGLCAALLCKKAGASLVVVTETHPHKLEQIPQTFPEIDGVFDAKDSKTMEKLGIISGGGFDACIECCGYESAVTTALCLSKVSGRVVLAGTSIDNISIPSVIALIREIEIRGSMGYYEKEFRMALDMMGDQDLDFRRMLSEIIPLEEVDVFLNSQSQTPTSSYKVLIKVND